MNNEKRDALLAVGVLTALFKEEEHANLEGIPSAMSHIREYIVNENAQELLPAIAEFSVMIAETNCICDSEDFNLLKNALSTIQTQLHNSAGFGFYALCALNILGTACFKKEENSIDFNFLNQIAGWILNNSLPGDDAETLISIGEFFAKLYLIITDVYEDEQLLVLFDYLTAYMFEERTIGTNLESIELPVPAFFSLYEKDIRIAEQMAPLRLSSEQLDDLQDFIPEIAQAMHQANLNFYTAT